MITSGNYFNHKYRFFVKSVKKALVWMKHHKLWQLSTIIQFSFHEQTMLCTILILLKNAICIKILTNDNSFFQNLKLMMTNCFWVKNVNSLQRQAVNIWHDENFLINVCCAFKRMLFCPEMISLSDRRLSAFHCIWQTEEYVDFSWNLKMGFSEQVKNLQNSSRCYFIWFINVRKTCACCFVVNTKLNCE